MQEDISDRWLKIEHIFELNKKGPGVKRKHSTRAIFNGIMYVLKTGCQWSRLSECYLPYKRVHENIIMKAGVGISGKDKTYGVGGTLHW